MQQKFIFNCVKLCLLIAICAAAPAFDPSSDSSSDSDDPRNDPGKVVKLAAPASDPDSSSDTDGPDRGNIVKLAGDENAKNTGANNEGLSDGEDANGDPIKAEDGGGKDDTPVADEAKDAEGDNAVQDNEDPNVKANAPVADADNAVQDDENPGNADEAPAADVTGEDHSVEDNEEPAQADEAPAADVTGEDHSVEDNEEPAQADEAPAADVTGEDHSVEDNEEPAQANKAPAADVAGEDHSVEDNEEPAQADEAPAADVAGEGHSLEDNEETAKSDEAPAADEADVVNAVQDNKDPGSSGGEDAPAADEPIDEENKNNEIDYIDAPYKVDPGFGGVSGFKLSPAEMTKFKIWPEARIPYYIDELSYDKALRDKIRHYLDEARSLTGLRFEELLEPPELDDNRWVFFVNRRGQLDCKDYNTNSFTITGVQKVIIGYNCLQHGGPMAAIVMSLAGVPPQHNAPDRDKYIKVDTDHILPEKRGLFKRLKDGEWLFHDIPYDFNSVSHYPLYKYTADGHATIKLTGGQKLKQKSQRSRKAIGFGSNTYPRWLFGDDEDMISLHDEKKTYSGKDLFKISLLYSNIMQNKPQGIKETDCKALYRAGPNFRNMKLTKPAKIPERPKPAKYLAAVKNDNSPEKLSHPIDVKGELLSELSS